MALEKVRGAYEAIFGDVSKFSIYLETFEGKVAVVLLIVSAILLAAIWKLFSTGNSEQESLSNTELLLMSMTFLSAAIFIYFAAPLLKDTKDELIIKHPDYEAYVESYVTPYLTALPEKRYENLKVVEHPRGGLYLTHASVDSKSIEKVKSFDISDLEFVLIEDNESSYISEVVLEDDLGGEFEVGYEKHVAYINPADRKIIEEHLGEKINIIQD